MQPVINLFERGICNGCQKTETGFCKKEIVERSDQYMTPNGTPIKTISCKNFKKTVIKWKEEPKTAQDRINEVYPDNHYKGD